jgi:hypothetical protein
MAQCEVCGNEYYLSFEVITATAAVGVPSGERKMTKVRVEEAAVPNSMQGNEYDTVRDRNTKESHSRRKQLNEARRGPPLRRSSAFIRLSESSVRGPEYVCN